MKISTVLAASALSVVAAQASAAPVTIDGTGALTSTNPYLASTSAFSGSGTNDGTTITFTQYTTNTTAVGSATITATGSFDIATGIGSSNVISCSGAALVCGSVPIGPGTFNWATYDSSNPNDIVITLSDLVVVPGLGSGNLSATINYTTSAVPVPAAAWLFGSALIGLAGIGRKRK